MKTSTLVKNGVSEELVSLIARLVASIPWPMRRSAMGDVTLALLEGKHRVAEDVFGWGRSAVELGIKEVQSGILCVNDISQRVKPKIEEKNPELFATYKALWSHIASPILICAQPCCIQT